MKFYNLLTLTLTYENNWLKIKDFNIEEKLFHENEERIKDLYECITRNKTNFNIIDLFPKKFIELDERLGEKI